jgi:hypothetical protein
MELAQPASSVLVWSFTGLTLLVAGCIPAGLYVAARRLGEPAVAARRQAGVAAAIVVLWLTVTGVAAASGRLAFGPLPPPIAILFILVLAGAAAVAWSSAGRRLVAGLPLSVLVGFHGFRLPLELLMHQAYAEGVMPVQMSYSGLNFDVVTGATAILVGVLLAAGRMPLWGVRLWNAAGGLLLANVVTVGWLSTPTPLRVFHNAPANVWITQAPFVWLPAVLVFAALLGHILVHRRVQLERGTADVRQGAGGRIRPVAPRMEEVAGNLEQH